MTTSLIIARIIICLRMANTIGLMKTIFVSPHCREMHKNAAKNMERSSKKVIKQLKHKAGNVHVGDVVHIPLVQQDR